MGTGIMLLEKQLLSSTEGGGARPAKRARGALAPTTEVTTMWMELARYAAVVSHT